MEFTCTKCIGKSFPRLRGWKSHMTREHGGYDETDVAAAVSAANGETVSEDNVSARMTAFASSLPGQNEEGVSVGVDSEHTATSAQQSPPPPAAPPVKTIKATPKKLKKILGAIPAKILEGAVELDDEDREALDEAGEFLTDIFGVEFEVPQEKRVLHSRVWALVWVAGVALLIYVKHKYADVWQSIMKQYQKQKEEGENASTKDSI